MKALVKTAPGVGKLELAADWPEPVPGPHEVKMRVAAAGICGTDLHILAGRWRCDPPVVLGHEWSGTVVETGSQVKTFRPGDRLVAANPARTCGLCRYCQAGNPFMCPERVSAGYMIDGAFAEYISIDEKRCHRLPDSVSFREAALGEPISVAVHAVTERTTVHAGDLVLVSGCGCIGLLTAQMAKLEGARVIVAGLARDRARLECAKACGADAVVNVEEDDLQEVVRRFSDGWGADIVYECAGQATSLAACWRAIRKQGVLAQVGVHAAEIQTDFGRIMMHELTVYGSYGYVWTSWRRTVQLLCENRLRLDALISHELPLERFEDAFRAAQEGSAVKVLLYPDGTGVS